MLKFTVYNLVKVVWFFVRFKVMENGVEKRCDKRLGKGRETEQVAHEHTWYFFSSLAKGY